MVIPFQLHSIMVWGTKIYKTVVFFQNVIRIYNTEYIYYKINSSTNTDNSENKKKTNS